mmetsp:Transcript_38900/g.124809  ORF Transcript_38900/g.124809 Transcript_38900/m.124809 type:complete len:437 (-) Transcript_38900:1791-3101(-)
MLANRGASSSPRAWACAAAWAVPSGPRTRRRRSIGAHMWSPNSCASSGTWAPAPCVSSVGPTTRCATPPMGGSTPGVPTARASAAWGTAAPMPPCLPRPLCCCPVARLSLASLPAPCTPWPSSAPAARSGPGAAAGMGASATAAPRAATTPWPSRRSTPWASLRWRAGRRTVAPSTRRAALCSGARAPAVGWASSTRTTPWSPGSSPSTTSPRSGEAERFGYPSCRSVASTASSSRSSQPARAAPGCGPAAAASPRARARARSLKPTACRASSFHARGRRWRCGAPRSCSSRPGCSTTWRSWRQAPSSRGASERGGESATARKWMSTSSRPSASLASISAEGPWSTLASRCLPRSSPYRPGRRRRTRSCHSWSAALCIRWRLRMAASCTSGAATRAASSASAPTSPTSGSPRCWPSRGGRSVRLRRATTTAWRSPS